MEAETDSRRARLTDARARLALQDEKDKGATKEINHVARRRKAWIHKRRTQRNMVANSDLQDLRCAAAERGTSKRDASLDELVESSGCSWSNAHDQDFGRLRSDEPRARRWTVKEMPSNSRAARENSRSLQDDLAKTRSGQQVVRQSGASPGVKTVEVCFGVAALQQAEPPEALPKRPWFQQKR